MGATPGASMTDCPAWASKAVRWAAALCALALLAGAGKVAAQKAALGFQGERYLVVSSRPAERDEAFLRLAEQTDVLRYTRADSMLARKLAGWREPGGPVAVYTERQGRTVSVSSSPVAIGKALDAAELSLQSGSIPAVYVGAAAGGLVGAFLAASSPAFVLLWLVAASACLIKAVVACPTCEPSLVFGAPLESLGAAAYGLAAVAAAALRTPAAAWGLGAAGVLAGQIAMTWATGADCAPCGVVAAANAAAVAMAAVRPGASARALGWRLAAAVGIGATALAAGSFRWAAPAGEPVLRRASTRWLGRDVRSLGGIEPPTSGRAFIVLWSAGCKPCDEALARLAAEDGLEARLYQVVPPGTATEPGRNALPVGPGLDRTPAFLIVGSDGVVVSERYGWSPDEAWVASFLADVRHHLAARESADDPN